MGMMGKMGLSPKQKGQFDLLTLSKELQNVINLQDGLLYDGYDGYDGSG